jgi:putative addiction module component
MGMPSPRVRAVIELLDEMSEEERKELRDELEGECAPNEWKRAWNDELARRISQIEAGEVELVDGDEVLAELRRDMAT